MASAASARVGCLSMMSDSFAPAEPQELAERLNEILAEVGEPSLEPEVAARFGAYAVLLMRWNARINLTAVRDSEGILRRHFVESIICARFLPVGVATLLDFGSGAGFPGIPIALCRPEISVTLAESQGKKTAFLREAARVLELNCHIYGGRAELIGARFECVALRAVERMGEAVASAGRLVGESGYLVLLTTTSDEDAVKGWAGEGFLWEARKALPDSSERIALLGRRQSVPRGTQ
jgi:16S rRNA (guanine527-N7)-methyltransferase